MDPGNCKHFGCSDDTHTTFQHILCDCYSENHNQPIPGMRRFEVIHPWWFLCAASTPTFSRSEVILAPGDHAIFEALTHSVLSISVCVLEFGGKRGWKAVEEEQDDDDVDSDA